MNEITRIHLAKISYEIEVEAKKELERYFSRLKSFSDDQEMSSDIEIRMTEILASRGVHKNDVITKTDVDALTEQLGDPQEFMVDDATLPTQARVAQSARRKLFRSTDDAMVGGVLSGIAAYYGIRSLWTRLIFIVVAFASLGLAIIAYAILWIAVPPVRTAADKLQLRGQAVTVGAMRELVQTEGPIDQTRDARARRVLTLLLGIGFSVATLAALIATAIGAAGTIMRTQHMEGHTYLMAHMNLAYWMIGLAVASGILLSLLGGMAAVASFSQKLSRKLIICGVVVILLGLVTSGSLIALGLYVSEQNQAQISRQTQSLQVPVNGDLASATSLEIVSSGNFSVHYNVSDQTTGATMIRWNNGTTHQAMPQLVVKDGVATLTVNASNDDSLYVRPQLTITGPALTKLTYAKGNVALDYNAVNQDSLIVNIKQDGDVQLTGQINTVTTQIAAGGTLDAEHASIQSVVATTGNDSHMYIGTVNQLQVTTREVCAADNKTSITVGDVTSGKLTFNGTLKAVGSSESTCTSLSVAGPYNQ